MGGLVVEGKTSTHALTASSDIPLPPLWAFIQCSCSRRHLYMIAYGEGPSLVAS